MYYTINEDLARTSHELGHHGDYVENSATENYRASIDKIMRSAEQQKTLVKPSYHEMIDRMVDRYAKKLADLINKTNNVNVYYPSSFITGRSGRSRKKARVQSDRYSKLAEGWNKLSELEAQINNFSERKGFKANHV